MTKLLNLTDTTYRPGRKGRGFGSGPAARFTNCRGSTKLHRANFLNGDALRACYHSASHAVLGGAVMTIATTSTTSRRSLLQHIPELALALAGTALVLLALGPIGWRAGWWHFRFSLLTLMPWAAYFGLAAVIVSVLALVIGLSRLDRRGTALALMALIGGGLIAYVPWHYDQIRQTVPPIHD